MTTLDTRRPTARIASLAWPILIGQLAVIANGVIDTAMTARYSATDLAALSIGVSIYLSVFVGTSGVLQALSPVIGQMFGGKRLADIGAEFKQGLWLAVFLTVAGGAVLIFPQPLLRIAQAAPELQDKAAFYLQALAWGLPASLAFRAYAALNHAIARPKAVMAIQVAVLLLKIPLNALFIFGAMGIPAFGGPGCAIATSITMWLGAAAAYAIMRRDSVYRPFRIFGSGFARPRWTAQFALLRLGLPIGASYLIEVSAFAFMALFIARFGAPILAGHQVVSNFVTVLYMLPLSIASATGTLTAHAIGAGDMRGARAIGMAGVRLAAALALGLALTVALVREAIVRTYTPDAAVIAVALPLFWFVAFYHVCDALQVTAAFVLRAYKVVLVPTLIYACLLWGVGLGGGYALGFGIIDTHVDGAAGFWLANTASVGLAAVALLWYLLRVQRQHAG